MYQKIASRTACAGLIALAGAASAPAQDLGTDATTTLDQILVTDGHIPVTLAQSGHAVTVITGEQLQQDDVQYIADALREVPGLAVSRTGADGGFTQIRIRGSESNHVLVMIDGVEVSETSSGEFDFGSLVVDDIDRIEVLRGPQSGFWGSNASAGVINIITKRGQRNGYALTTRTEAGTDGTVIGAARLSGGGENYDISLSAMHRHTDGFNISDYGSEKDGDDNTTLDGKFDADIAPQFSVDGSIRYVERLTDTDTQDFTWGSPTYGLVIDSDNQTATKEVTGGIGLTYSALDGALVQKLRWTGSHDHRDNYASGVISNWTEGSRSDLSYQAAYSFDTGSTAHHTFSAGLDWQRETFLPSHLTSEFTRNTKSLVAEYRGSFEDQFFLDAGIRYDINDAFANAFTYNLSGAWQIPDTGTKLHASLGTGVTDPTFYEQYGYLPAYFTGNPDLTPEYNFGWDAGVEQQFLDGGLVLDLTYFNENLTDEIATAYTATGSTVVNLTGESKRQGVEVSAKADFFNGLTATATYTYTDATQQKTAGGAETTEIRRPKHAGSLNLAYVFPSGQARIFGEMVYNLDMLDTDFATNTDVKLPDYAVVNIGGSYKLNDNFEAYAKIRNLFDTRYQEVLGYNAPGRAANIGLKGRF